MKKLFQHNYLLRITALLVLLLAVINISLPRIEQYNEKVRQEQNRLAREAGSNRKAVSFEIYSFNDTGQQLNLILTFVLTALFLSLVLTKRIILSWLFALILFLQIVIIFLIAPLLHRKGFHFIETVYYEAFVIICLLAFSFGMAFAICRFFGGRFEAKILLK